jgi:hypothetical protein
MSIIHSLIGSVSSSGGVEKFNAWGGLISQWKGQASTLADTSGAGNNGTTTGALINADAKLVGSYGLQNTWTDTQDRYHRAATLSAMGATSAFSFSGWSKFTGTATVWDSIVGGGPGSWASGFGIYVKNVTSATNIDVTGWANGYSSHGITKTSLNPQNWNHYALTYDGSTFAFYVNGTQIGTDSSISGAVTSTAPGIGNFTDTGGTWGYGYDGYCDEYGFWSSGLTSAEITAIYNSGTPLDLTSDSGSYVSSSDLVGYYQFNSQNTYNVHAFRGTGTFTVSSGSSAVDYLIIGGGGGGGGQANSNSSGGGGGAGGVQENTSGSITVTSASSPYTITVGTGGAGGSNANGTVGVDSVALGVTASGGGYGGRSDPGGAGASGGGGGMDWTTTAAGGATSGSGTGNTGGTGGDQSAGTYGSGGGGGSGAGGTNHSGTNGGAGGAGSFQMGNVAPITPPYSGGGGGSGTGTQGAGGSSIGGTGKKDGTGGAAAGGVVNTGSGGGGGAYSSSATLGGDGGAGIVLIRYEVAS